MIVSDTTTPSNTESVTRGGGEATEGRTATVTQDRNDSVTSEGGATEEGGGSEICWEQDPLFFPFKEDVPGKLKMRIKALDIHQWIKIDSTYPQQMKLRAQLLSDKDLIPQLLVDHPNPTTQRAKHELLDLILQHILNRFPDIFKYTKQGIYNKVTKETTPLTGEDPLIIASRLVQEDWCILEWSEEKQLYQLTAGAVLFPFHWVLTEKHLQTLPNIHVPVTAYTKHLRTNVNDLFEDITPTKSLCRANWAIMHDSEHSLDLFNPTRLTHTERFNTIIDTNDEQIGKKLTLRVEYQTFRRLPVSRAIVFGIRTYLRCLEEFERLPKEDAVALKEAVKNMLPEMGEYRSAKFWKDACLAYLERIINKAAL